MRRPDFACRDLSRLEARDLDLIIQNFPGPGHSYDEISRLIHTLPTTLESVLSSDYLFDKIWGRHERALQISPFLFFNVLLRRCWAERPSAAERKIINYIANLLSLFARTDRLYRVEPNDPKTYEYLIDLIAEAAEADSRRQFLIHTHIGNYALFLAGLFPDWIEHRHRYKRRPVDMQYYIDFGRTHFQQAAQHPMAREFQLDDIFLRLAMLFEAYKANLNELARRYLWAPPSTDPSPR